MTFNKSKWYILCLEWSNTQHKGEKWLERAPVEGDLGVLVHSSSIGVNREPGKPGGQNPPWGNIKHIIKHSQTKKLIVLLFFDIGADSPRVSCAGLGPTI